MFVACCLLLLLCVVCDLLFALALFFVVGGFLVVVVVCRLMFFFLVVYSAALPASVTCTGGMFALAFTLRALCYCQISFCSEQLGVGCHTRKFPLKRLCSCDHAASLGGAAVHVQYVLFAR